jgi:WD40 repeat protein
LSILFVVAAPTLVAASTPVEFATDLSGIRSVRSLTPAAGEPLWSVPSAASTAAWGRESQDEYLWLDLNHLNATADDVAITGDGVYAIVGWWLNSERTALYRVDDDHVPEWTRSMIPVEFQISVGADDTGERLTSTGRHLPLYVFRAASSVEIFSHPYTDPLLGYYSAVADGGNTYMGAAGFPSGGDGEVRVYDGSGVLRFVDGLDNPPMGVSLSADGCVVATNVRTYVKVWDALTGALRDSLPIPGETQAAAVLSGDGTYLVTGGFSRTVRLYEWDGFHYVQLWAYTIPATTWIRCLAISEDGQTIAAGTWTNPTGGKVVLLDSASPTPLWTDATYGDGVSDLAMTPDGGVLAAASWGRQAGTVGNIISVYERASAIPLHGISDDAFAGVGSCFSVALNENGRYLVAGGKAVHARQMGHGGWVMAMELVDPAAVAVGEGGSVPSGGARLVAAPNPFGSSAQIALAGVASASPRGLRVLDAAGRLIRALPGPGPAGVCVWDGRDQLGQPVTQGTYFVRAAERAGDNAGAATHRALRLVCIR